jgi:hypothetical protein
MHTPRSLFPALLCLVVMPLACGDSGGETIGQSASSQPTTFPTSVPMTAAEASGDEPTQGGSGTGGVTGDATGTGDVSAGTTGSTGPGVDDTSGGTDVGTSAGPDGTSGGPTGASSSSEGGESGSSTGDACAEVSVEAENKKQPADIIFVIDNSGSMDFEEGAVQSNMNTFSGKIIASGVDAHVVLISNYNVCIDKPLGSGGCPNFDTNLPQFLHIDDGIGSNNALAKILEHQADWAPSMRPDGAKHIIVVSDDDADMNPATFHATFQALGPEYVDYKFHAIVGLWDAEDFGKCFADPVCCATIADEGEAYKSLTGLTGGVLGALCDGGKQDFAGLFDVLSTEVIAEATIACEWDIPEPMGEDIDFNKVNVDYLDGMGGDQAIPKVADAAACLDLEAWYYDDPVMPTKIFACPTLCMKIQGNPMAKVDVKFGCESLVPQ